MKQTDIERRGKKVSGGGEWCATLSSITPFSFLKATTCRCRVQMRYKSRLRTIPFLTQDTYTVHSTPSFN
jgi:hypothetical protein